MYSGLISSLQSAKSTQKLNCLQLQENNFKRQTDKHCDNRYLSTIKH